MTGDQTEQHRLECEARAWLAETGGDTGLIEALFKRLAVRRSKESVERLRAEMRQQYRLQKRQRSR